MKNLFIGIILATLATSVFAEDRPVLKDTKDKVSYSFGLNFGTNLKQQNVEVNSDAFVAGLKDGLSGKAPLLTQEQIRETMLAFEKEMEQKQAAIAQKNAADGEKFLGDNKNKPGIKTTASGLQYKVEKEGSGESPKETDTVTVNYRGTLVDGTEFDSSYKRGQPASFPVNGVIPGWTEALQLMKPGAKYQLFIPAKLGYGERGRPGLPPNSTLIFEVELLSAKPAETAAPPPSPAAAASAKPSASKSP